MSEFNPGRHAPEIRSDVPYFVLTAMDPAAPFLVEAWAAWRASGSGDDAIATLATAELPTLPRKANDQDKAVAAQRIAGEMKQFYAGGGQLTRTLGSVRALKHKIQVQLTHAEVARVVEAFKKARAPRTGRPRPPTRMTEEVLINAALQAVQDAGIRFAIADDGNV